MLEFSKQYLSANFISSNILFLYVFYRGKMKRWALHKFEMETQKTPLTDCFYSVYKRKNFVFQKYAAIFRWILCTLYILVTIQSRYIFEIKMMHGILFFPNEVPSSSNNSKTLENDLGEFLLSWMGKTSKHKVFLFLMFLQSL